MSEKKKNKDEKIQEQLKEEKNIKTDETAEEIISLENTSHGDNEGKNEDPTINETVDDLAELNSGKEESTESAEIIPDERTSDMDGTSSADTEQSTSWIKNNFKIAIPIGALAIALVVYIGGFFYYSNNFLPNTIINGKNYGGKSVKQVQEDLQSPVENELVLVGRDGKEEIFPLATIGYTEEVEQEEIEKIYNSQNSAGWIVKVFSKEQHDIEADANYDADALYKMVHGLEIVSGKDIQEPEDARIEKVDGGYTVIPETLGNKVSTPELKKAIISATALGDTKIDLEKNKCYKNPEVKSDSAEITKTLNQLEPLEKLVITFDFETTEEKLDYKTFSPWIQLGSSGLDFDHDQVEGYVKDLGKKYDTLNTNREFQSSARGVITVGGGIYGWQIDRRKTTEQIVELLKSGKSVTVEPVYFSYARARGDNDIGNTYFELDLTNQHMWLYINGELLADTGVVTGLPTEQRATPAGVFAVWSKETGRYLEGEDYKLWVDYWMPIDWTGVGIHDAPWQEIYGGDRYLVYGSHGCVNTPPPLFPLIFDSIEIGTPVVVYH